MATMTVELPETMKGWIEEQVDEGGYASASEYLADLIRQDQEWLEELRRIADDGLASGISTKTVDEIFDGAVKRARERGLLNDE